MSSDVSPSPAAALPYVDPFVGADEVARERDEGRADALLRRARALLDDTFGAEGDAAAGTHVAHGSIGVQADQTHYSDGFALFLGTAQAVAVALRRSDGGSRVVFAPEAEPHDLGAASPAHEGVGVMQRVLDRCVSGAGAGPGPGVEAAVVNTLPPVCRDAALSALGVATVRAAGDWAGTGEEALDVPCTGSVATIRNRLVPAVAEEVEAVTGRPTSTAYPLAACVASPSTFLLLDTATGEHLPVETGAGGGGALDWAVLDPGVGATADPAFHRRRREEAAAALDRLRASGVADVEAFRDLEHRDLQAAVDALPERLRPVARHLVTENRRVQKHVAALRRTDWQMTGALLLMSHASHRNHFGDSTAVLDAIVDDAEGLTFEGSIYGASLASRDGAVLVTGRPPSFTDGLQTLADTFHTRTGRPLRVMRP